MTDKSEFSFAVVRFNERTYQSGGVVAIIKGVEAAKRTLANFDRCQSEENLTGHLLHLDHLKYGGPTAHT
jgi:hypothetical protein